MKILNDFWLGIHIANCAGLKGTIQHRYKWYNDNKDKLYLGNINFIFQPEHDPLALAAAITWYQDYVHGKPSGAMVKLDATSSGLQILSVMTGSVQLAKLTNVLESGSRQDIYSDFAASFNTLYSVAEPDTHPALGFLYGLQLTRKIAKLPVMAFAYSIGQAGIFASNYIW